jgi:hypothetical protein
MLRIVQIVLDLTTGEKSFIVINTMLLRVTMADPTSYVTSKSTIGFFFFTKDPFARDYVSVWRARDQLPSVVCKRSTVFILHGSSPVGIK